jgi:hypothetical protein
MEEGSVKSSVDPKAVKKTVDESSIDSHSILFSNN